MPGPLRSWCWPASAGHQLDPAHVPMYLMAWLGFTGFHCVAGALIRRANWWRPADESSRNLPWPLFAAGVLLLSGNDLRAALRLDPESKGAPALTGAFPGLRRGLSRLGVPKNVLLWARLTAPDLGEPGGLLQQKVAEIFSSDRPPF